MFHLEGLSGPNRGSKLHSILLTLHIDVDKGKIIEENEGDVQIQVGDGLIDMFRYEGALRLEIKRFVQEDE